MGAYGAHHVPGSLRATMPFAKRCVRRSSRSCLVRRDEQRIKRDIAQMRARIEREKHTTDIWNIKQVPGGLVDVEFIAQGLQLMHAHKHPEILHASTDQSLRLCVDRGLVDNADADILLPAIRLYHDVTQILRVCLSESFRPQQGSCTALKDVVVRASQEIDMRSLEEKLREYPGRCQSLLCSSGRSGGGRQRLDNTAKLFLTRPRLTGASRT